MVRLELHWKIITKVTTALGHSSPKREQCDAVKQFVSSHDAFVSLLR